MTKITPEVAQAFVNLRGNSDFSTVLKWMEESKANEAEACINQDGLLLYRAQGAAKFAHTFLKHYADAPTTLQKFRNQPRPKANTQ